MRSLSIPGHFGALSVGAFFSSGIDKSLRWKKLKEGWAEMFERTPDGWRRTGIRRSFSGSETIR